MKIRGTKASPADVVNLLNSWQGRIPRSQIHLAVISPEITTMLSVFITKVDFPTIVVALDDDGWQEIHIHLSGSLLERFGNSEGIGTMVRASWLLSWISGKTRQITLAETAEDIAACQNASK